jgi:hypothetical protein
VRIVAVSLLLTAGFFVSCASTPDAGPLGEGTSLRAPLITTVDTAHPPHSLWVQLQDSAYVAVLLVAPGHSATLLYPREQFTSNQLTAGAHQLTFDVPDLLVSADSLRDAERAAARQRIDSAGRTRARRRTGANQPMPAPLSPIIPTYFLVITSPQPLVYQRIVDRTAGVSIPTDEIEALNAVAKAVKSTLPHEPREWAGYYRRVDLKRRQ